MLISKFNIPEVQNFFKIKQSARPLLNAVVAAALFSLIGGTQPGELKIKRFFNGRIGTSNWSQDGEGGKMSLQSSILIINLIENN
ncbi:MAG: hypothetical protein ONA69_01750 [candidate division KSB1 bacterium]|nr:hypothetical protein [candidate division KSB1 bacterium]MDZ7345497.1 hypothetical protein [candidate division KSB1 bacterium]